MKMFDYYIIRWKAFARSVVTTWRAAWQTVCLACCLLLTAQSSFAITKANADSAYRKGNYQQAIIDYKELLKKGVSPQLYYNLGNAYYRSDNIAQAILAYERAALLSPGNSDIRFNLQFARSKTIDKIVPGNEMFFITWYKSLVNFTSVDHWATLAIAAIIVALLLMLAYLFAPQLAVRKVGFFGSLASLLVFACSCLFAWQQKCNLECHAGAIVVTPSVGVKKQPVASGSDVFVLHEGTHVDITDTSMKGWYGIQVGDGREGWIQTANVEKI